MIGAVHHCTTPTIADRAVEGREERSSRDRTRTLVRRRVPNRHCSIATHERRCSLATRIRAVLARMDAAAAGRARPALTKANPGRPGDAKPRDWSFLPSQPGCRRRKRCPIGMAIAGSTRTRVRRRVSSRRANWAATAVMLIGVVALMLPFGATFAASRKSAPSLYVGCNTSCVVGGSLAVRGSGFTPSSGGQQVMLWVEYPADYCAGSTCHGFYYNPWVNDDGTFSHTFDNAILQAGEGGVEGNSVQRPDRQVGQGRLRRLFDPLARRFGLCLSKTRRGGPNGAASSCMPLLQADRRLTVEVGALLTVSWCRSRS